jgi:hypothetical protein
MTALTASGREFAAAALGAAAGLAAALVVAPVAAEGWAFVRHGFESTLFAYFLC